MLDEPFGSSADRVRVTRSQRRALRAHAEAFEAGSPPTKANLRSTF